MKRVMICVFLCIAFLSFFSGKAVFADAIAEPANPFYHDNPRECEFISWRSFEVREDSPLLESPLDSVKNGEVKKGETVYSGFTYTDENGVVWCCCSFWFADNSDERKDGWIEKDKLSEIYNVFTFIDEHDSEMTDYNGELDSFIPKNDVILWEYPMGSACGRVPADKAYTRETYPFEKQELGDRCWTDEKGNVWVYIYRYICKGGDRYDNCWIFASDPEAEELSAYGYDISASVGTAVSGSLSISEEETEKAYESAVKSLNHDKKDFVLPFALSAGTVLLSLILLKAIKK